MLTSRGWLLFIVILAQIAVGLWYADRPGTGSSIALIGIVLLAWFLAEWLIFLIRVE